MSKSYHVNFNFWCPVVLEKILNIFSLYSNEKRWFPIVNLPYSTAHDFNKLESDSPKDDLYTIWLKMVQLFWIWWRCEKVTDRWTENRQNDRRQTNGDLNSDIFWDAIFIILKLTWILKSACPFCDIIFTVPKVSFIKLVYG